MKTYQTAGRPRNLAVKRETGQEQEFQTVAGGASKKVVPETEVTGKGSSVGVRGKKSPKGTAKKSDGNWVLFFPFFWLHVFLS